MAGEVAYTNINGIPKSFVHEQTNKETGNVFYNVGIQVPYEFSRNGIANVTTNKIFPCKNDSEKVNIGFPKSWELNVEVCKFHDKDDSKNNKYETIKISPDKLLSEHIDYLKSRKDKEQTAEAEKEEDGMDR